MDILQKLTDEFSLKPWQVENTVKLIDDGNTIPFIARYRKEVTGSLDDQLLRNLSDRLTYLRNMEEQKDKIISSIEEQNLMTDEIRKSVENATTLTELEDIYRPFRPKRKTRASVAKAKGLQGLADFVYAQDKNCSSPIEEAEKYLNDEVESIEDAINGARILLLNMFQMTRQVEKCLDILSKTTVILLLQAQKTTLAYMKCIRNIQSRFQA